MNLPFVGLAALATVTVLSTIAGCGDPAPPISSSGGNTLTGGAGPLGGGGTTASGGVGGTAGAAAGSASGGQSSGGQSTGGQSSGGQSSGGSSPNGGGSAIPATFATVAGLVKDRTTPHACFGGSCHDSENPYFHLLAPDNALLSDDALYTFMKGYTTRNCGPLINVANPGESALVKLLKGACGATPVMPLDKCYVDKGTLAGDCVPPETVSAIQQWIAAGAPR